MNGFEIRVWRQRCTGWVAVTVQREEGALNILGRWTVVVWKCTLLSVARLMMRTYALRIGAHGVLLLATTVSPLSPTMSPVGVVAVS